MSKRNKNNSSHGWHHDNCDLSILAINVDCMKRNSNLRFQLAVVKSSAHSQRKSIKRELTREFATNNTAIYYNAESGLCKINSRIWMKEGNSPPYKSYELHVGHDCARSGLGYQKHKGEPEVCGTTTVLKSTQFKKHWQEENARQTQVHSNLQ